jgi:hypothetical protein
MFEPLPYLIAMEYLILTPCSLPLTPTKTKLLQHPDFLKGVRGRNRPTGRVLLCETGIIDAIQLDHFILGNARKMRRTIRFLPECSSICTSRRGQAFHESAAAGFDGASASLIPSRKLAPGLSVKDSGPRMWTG